MSKRVSVNIYLKNYQKSIDLNIANRIKILNAFDKNLIGSPIKQLAFSFDEVNFEDVPTFEHWTKKYIDKPDTFSLNSNNFRSDEFKKEHDGKHILFAGCSVTYGVGLYVNETWPYLLYNKIKEKEKVSGYYNISIPANSIYDNVINIFKYINNYGKPDVIFLNLPDFSRFYTLIENIASSSMDWQEKTSFGKTDDFSYFKDKYFHSLFAYKKDEESTIIYEKLIYIYQYLLMLEVFCKTNNIQLYLFSWDIHTNNFLNSDAVELSSFYFIPLIPSSWIYDYSIKNEKDEFYLKARDGSHYGTVFHDYWSQKMYDIYMKENYVN